jgi:hemolysin activation/secretion protein
MNPQQGPVRLSSIVAVAMFTYAVAAPVAQAAPPIELPAGVSPGGALPSLDRDSLRRKKPSSEVPDPSRDEVVPVPESGVRMNVKAFELEGVIDHPERGISLEDLEKRVEAIRITRPRGFTISEMQEVTDEITRVYRGAGYILARAYIPEQEVTDGRVVIRILEGMLEQLSFEGNQDYSGDVLRLPFEEIINQPVNREEIERALLDLSDYPGLRFNSVFSPGEALGTAKLGVNIESEKSIEGTVWLDNHGSAFTGEYRLWADASYNNPSGAADRLSAQILTTMGDNDGKSNYYALSYERPIFGPRNLVSIDASNNAYSVGGDFAPLDLKGKSSIYNVSLRRKFIRSRKMNVEGRAVLSSKKSSSDLSYLNIGEDALTVLTLGAIADYRNTSSGYTQAALHYSQGIPGVLGAMDEDGDGNSSRTGGSGDAAGGDFSKLNLHLAHWQPLLFSTMVQNQSILGRIEVQSSSDLLVSMEQMPLGGPNSVRAYPPAEYMVDSGHFISLEWIAKSSSATKGKFFENLQFSAFYDYAAGELNDPLANDVDAPELQGYGASIQLAPENEYIARLELATPIGDPDPSNDRSIQYFFKFGYMF